MGRNILAKISLLLLSGCMSNNSLVAATLAQENVQGLSQVTLGMTEGEVLRIMPNPQEKKTIHHNGELYQVWFYITRPTTLTQNKLTRQNVTPLAFENGVLVGLGFDYYDHLLQPSQEHSKPQLRKKKDSLQKELDHLEHDDSDAKETVMSKKPRTEKPKEEEKDDQEDSEKEKGFGRQGRKMKEEASDQDFNFW